MSEVKSAKEIVKQICAGTGRDWYWSMSDKEAEALIISDRRAIIEKCKETIQKTINEWGDILPNGVEVVLTGSDLGRISDALDSVLSEIENEE